MPKPKQLNHVTVLVTDKKRAEAFYCGILGLEAHSFGEGGKHLWVRVGTQYVHLTDNSGSPRPGSFDHFAIGYDDFEILLGELVTKGVEVFDMDENAEAVHINEKLDEKNRQFFVRDPDGNLIEIFDLHNAYFNPAGSPK